MLRRVDAREANGGGKTARTEHVDNIAVGDANDFRGEVVWRRAAVHVVPIGLEPGRRNTRDSNGARLFHDLRALRCGEMENPCAQER
jgi:hypothetical protein